MKFVCCRLINSCLPCNMYKLKQRYFFVLKNNPTILFLYLFYWKHFVVNNGISFIIQWFYSVRGHCWHVGAWRGTVAVNVWNACQWLCLSWWWIWIFVGNGIYVDLHVTQHAKGQTMNIYSANSAPNRQGVLEPVAHYMESIVWSYMSSPPMWLQNCDSLLWNKDFQMLLLCIIIFFPKTY